MTGTTITGTFSSTYTLTPAQNPATLDVNFTVSIPTGVSNSYTPAVEAPSGTVWTVTNHGSLSSQYAFRLDGTGTVTNAAGGRMTGRRDGLRATASGTVVNAGLIAGSTPTGFGVELQAGGSVTNVAGGTIASARGAVYVRNGGYVTNAATGTIDGMTEILDAPGTVFNAGLMNTGLTGGLGIYLNSGGTVANAAGATIGNGVKIGNVAGSVTNSGSINSSSYGVALGIGEVDNLATGKITAASFGIGVGSGLFSPPAGEIVNNAGTIAGVGGGVLLRGQGTVTNTGSIASSAGVGVSLTGGGVVTNAAGKTISAGTDAIAAAAAAVVDNSGTLLGSRAIFLAAGGTATNEATGVLGATIGFGSMAYGIDVRGAAGTVTNAGTIGAKYYAIALRQGGTATNGSTGVLYAHGTDIVALTAASTVINSGSLSGANGGILLGAGGYARNDASGVISVVNGYGMVIGTGGGTMVNFGHITQTKNGFAFSGGAGMGRPATLINQGGGSIKGFAGVWVDFGGAVTNAANGTITGYQYGVVGFNNVVTPVTIGTTIDNSGSIGGTFWGVMFKAGGTVTNRAGASISGPFKGVAVYNIGATIANYGTITGATGIIFNDQTATANQTVINGGLIVGTSSTAVSFGNGNDRLIVKPGAAFQGSVSGGGGANVLELGGAGTGLLSGLGTTITNFGSVVFDSGANWTIASNAAGVSGTIAGFAAGDVINLVGLNETISSFTAGTLTLGGSQNMSIVFSGAVPGSFQATPDVVSGTDISLACFVAGTRIRGASGDVAVEDLRVGDVVKVVRGRRRGVIWIGQRTIYCARHMEPVRVWPVRIAASAFGPARPARDLFLSPDHAVFVDGILVPAGTLVNGTTVTRVPLDQVRYFHVELEQHDIVYAEGLPVESYLDTGGRAAFDSRTAVLQLRPDFGPALREAHGCAPLMVVGAAVDRVRARLASRAALLADAAGSSESPTAAMRRAA